jgi:tRNA-dihydrouridine synthase
MLRGLRLEGVWKKMNSWLEDYELYIILVEQDIQQLAEEAQKRDERLRELKKHLAWMKRQLKKARALERKIHAN